MKSIGSFMFIIGLASTIFHFLDRELIILTWINNWGETVGWVIRGALMVIGGGLWLTGKPDEPEETA